MPVIALFSLGFGFGPLHLLVAFILEIFISLPAVVLVLLIEARAVLAQNAEIVIRILQVIFGLDAVTGELRVTRQALVFLEQLRGITALTVVLPVPRLTAEVLTSLSTATTPAAALTIIYQMPTSLRSSSQSLGPSGRQAQPPSNSLGAAPDPLVPVCASKRHTNGRLRRGLGQDALSFL